MRKILAALALLYCCDLFAATYYVCDTASACNAASSGWVTGSDSNACTSKGAACKTFAGAWGKLSAGGGHTIIFGDGTYSGSSNAISNSSYPPYGAAGAYNVFKAEHDGSVTFNGAGVLLDYGSGNRAYYWQFEGLIWGGANFSISYGNHVKVLRCGGYNAGSGNIGQFEIMRGMSYALVEDSYAWGEARYKFLAYGRYSDVGATQTQKIIFRRVVARLDKENASGEPIAGIALYSVKDSLVQNAIVIDSDTQNYWTNIYSRNGCFYVPTTSDPASNITIENSVCLNVQFGGVSSDDAATGVVVKNNVFWKVNIDSGEWANYCRGSTCSWTNNTFGVSTQNDTYTSGYNSSGFQITNNLFYGIGGGGIVDNWGSVTHDYNTYYSSSGLPTLSAHEYSNRNPIWNASTNPTGALKYITQIEAGSNHAGAGSGGADIGATVTKQVGVSGTLYGDAGYDTVQATSMWPFPQEALIKSKMAAYTYTGINGARGFAATGTGLYGGPITLTSYIWEYLGNACPAIICGGSTTYTVTPSAGANGTISPSTPQTVNSGSTTAFTVTPSGGYTTSVGGTCGGSLVGATYTTNAITANCTVSASFSTTTTGAPGYFEDGARLVVYPLADTVPGVLELTAEHDGKSYGPILLTVIRYACYAYSTPATPPNELGG